MGPFQVPTWGPKGPIWPQKDPNWEKSFWAPQRGQIWSQLLPIGLTELESWLPHTLALYRASSGPPGTPKGPVLARNAPFWGHRGPRRAPREQIWSTLPPIGLTGLKSWLPHTLALYQASSGPPGTPKGPVLALNAPFGPQKGPNRAQIQNCCKPIMWPIKICARKALSQWKTPKHNLVYQLRENSKKLPFRALTGPQSLLGKKLYFWVSRVKTCRFGTELPVGKCYEMLSQICIQQKNCAPRDWWVSFVLHCQVK